MSGVGEKNEWSRWNNEWDHSKIDWSPTEKIYTENEEISEKVIFHKNVNKLEKYKEIENFLRDIFLAKKKKKIVECSPK
jgi:hypothetical protein